MYNRTFGAIIKSVIFDIIVRRHILMRKTLPLSSIRLYLKNPRLSESESEHKELCKMVQDQQKKLILLAKDIATYGINELDLLAVFPDKQIGYYRVAEGNRRITALKLLQHPDLISKEYPIISKEFTNIAKNQIIDFNNIDVAVFESETDPKMLHFLQIRHLGENGGIGTVRWNPTQKARFDYRNFGKEGLAIFFDTLESKGYLTRNQISSVTPTNWQRIFRPVGLEFLRLKKDGKSYKIIDGCEREFLTKITLIIDNLKGKTVGLVYGQQQIEKFIHDIEIKYNEATKVGIDTDKTYYPYHPTPGATDYEDRKASGESQDNFHNKSDGNQNYDTEKQYSESTNSNMGASAKKHERMPNDPYAKSKTVIPASVHIQSRNHRINQIIKELKTLNVETYPNACGCLLRALIELSAKEYLEYNSKKSNYDATNVEFKDAISLATSQLLQKKQIVEVEANAVKKETNAGGVRLLFNGYMHNTETYPSPIVIKGIFSTYCKFLKECLL